MAKDHPPAQATPSESGFTYRTVTRFWPRIAVGLVALAGIAEWVVGGITSDGALEFYAFAWATTTAGLWFLFEKAENALGAEGREKVVAWLGRTDFGGSVRSIPGQFALLFDKVFGERHFSWRCFFLSCVASLTVVLCVGLVVAGLAGPTFLGEEWRFREEVLALVIVPVILNFIPDYVSLLETRWAIRWMVKSGRVLVPLLVDVIFTTIISMVLMVGIISLLGGEGGPSAIAQTLLRDLTRRDFGVVGPAVFFYSAFFTSFWLWLYAGAVLLTRVLVRLGGGVGFLLQVTDVERQPFRSMGFTSVLLVSLMFLMGLPLLALAGSERLPTGLQAVRSAVFPPNLTRFYSLGGLIADAFEDGRSSEVKRLCAEYLAGARRFPDDWNYGNAIHQGNIYLGLVALDEDRLDDAKGLLLTAADTPGSPQLTSFGPNMLLAQGLLERGERQVVLEFLDRIGRFWDDPCPSVWREAVVAGESPDFRLKHRCGVVPPHQVH